MDAWVEDLSWGYFRSGKGWSVAAWTSRGISLLVPPRKTKVLALREFHSGLPALPALFFEEGPRPVPGWIPVAAHRAWSGRPHSLRRFDLSFRTPFQEGVLRAACLIPRGQIRTYAWAAGKAGSPGAFRAAGQALRLNPLSSLIPCHRVIASGGRLGGFGGDPGEKIRLLREEGLRVEGGLVQDPPYRATSRGPSAGVKAVKNASGRVRPEGRGALRLSPKTPNSGRDPLLHLSGRRS